MHPTSQTYSQPLQPEAQPLQPLSSDQLASLSDEALQARILACCNAMFSAQSEYERTGCFAAAGDRDRYYHAEADALIERGRRKGLVAQMERDRGLDGR